MKTKLSLILAFILFQSCKTQQFQSKTILPKIENQLEGELDYTKGGFELVQWQKGGDEITLGSIDEQGNIHFNLPEYDISALGRRHNMSSLQSQFNMIKCKGKGEYNLTGQALFKTPYDDVYSQMYPPMFIKKYGVSIAYVRIVSDEKMLIKGNWDKIMGSKYFWMYIDRDLEYKDTCVRESFKDPNLEFEMTADVSFKKGWNFIRSELMEVQNYGENNEEIAPKKTLFTIGNPNSKDIKWYIVRKMKSEDIEAAKKEFNMF